ncbi:hypothetical protein J6590_048802 [Homalodisca vitripennis]|nr:hypothetical protein J6590_048802 [Homalodisca vitripennis]
MHEPFECQHKQTPFIRKEYPQQTHMQSVSKPAPPGGHKKTRGFSVDTVCEKMMEDEGNWDCLSQFVRGILLEKKPDLDREVAQIP